MREYIEVSPAMSEGLRAAVADAWSRTETYMLDAAFAAIRWHGGRYAEEQRAAKEARYVVDETARMDAMKDGQ